MLSLDFPANRTERGMYEAATFAIAGFALLALSWNVYGFLGLTEVALLLTNAAISLYVLGVFTLLWTLTKGTSIDPEATA